MGWIIAFVVIVVLVLLLFVLKPKDHGGGYSAYFSKLNEGLKQAGIGTGRVLIDLDLLNENLDIIQQNIPSNAHYRIVVKSIPCIDLIRKISLRFESNKFLVVHRPFIKVIMDNFDSGIDILIGKPLPAFALREFYSEISKNDWMRAQGEIQWLVDTPQHLNDYLDFAIDKKLILRINLEIDIGLHRGGAGNFADLAKLFEVIQNNPEHLTFSGFMGYEGHVAHAPGIFTSSDQGCFA